MEASFSVSGATVCLKGTHLHGDEDRYCQESPTSVGLYNEFTLDDFVDAADNVTFSSKHVGCALIELESRYAPLLPTGKTAQYLFESIITITAHKLFDALSNRPQDRLRLQYQGLHLHP